MNSRSRITKPLKREFAEKLPVKFISMWVYDQEYGGFIRVLAYRRRWTNAKGKTNEKIYFWVTNLEWSSQEIVEMYRLRWCLENSFKALDLLDRTPGLNPYVIFGFFAMTFHVLGSLCFEMRSSAKTLARLMELSLQVEEKAEVTEMCWNDIPTRFARKLLLWAYYRPHRVRRIPIKY